MKKTVSGIEGTIIKLLEDEGFSRKAIEYYLKQVNVEKMENPTASFVFTGACGDTVEIYLKIKEDVIKDAKFVTTGCSASFAAGSALTEILKGKTLEEASKIEPEDILEQLGGHIPPQKAHCIHLVKRTLNEALKRYKESRENKRRG